MSDKVGPYSAAELEATPGSSAIIRIRSGGGEQTHASGYYYGVLAWEHPTAYDTPKLEVDPGATDCGLPLPMVRALATSTAVLLEVDGRSPVHASLVTTLLWLVERKNLAVPIWHVLPDYLDVPATARKLPALPAPLQDLELLDFEAVTVPSASTVRNAEFAFAARRARVLIGMRLCIVIWEDLDPLRSTNWETSAWPHYGLPGSSGLVPLTAGTADDAHGVALAVVDRIAEHNAYFLRNARTAVESMESGFLAMMAGDDRQGPDRLLASLRLVGQLEEYFAVLRVASVRLQRRVEISSLAVASSATLSHSGSIMIEDLASSVIDKCAVAREELRRAVTVVSATASILALRQQLEDERRTVRFRNLIAFGAITFSLVSVFVSLYGSNIDELAPGTRGSLRDLLLGVGLIAVGVFIAGIGTAAIGRWLRAR